MKKIIIGFAFLSSISIFAGELKEINLNEGDIAVVSVNCGELSTSYFKVNEEEQLVAKCSPVTCSIYDQRLEGIRQRPSKEKVMYIDRKFHSCHRDVESAMKEAESLKGISCKEIKVEFMTKSNPC